MSPLERLIDAYLEMEKADVSREALFAAVIHAVPDKVLEARHKEGLKSRSIGEESPKVWDVAS